MSEADKRDGRRAFFGRRASHKLRAGRAASVEALLPRLRISPDETRDPAGLFSFAPRDIHLEIGCGGGEHLIARALENPDVGFIACEAYIDGVAKLVGAIEANGLANVRIHDGDAIDLIARLPAASIGRVYLLYPDPWPKRRHRKRRFVSDERLAALARILKPGGDLRFATDIDDYAAWTLMRIGRSADFSWDAERSRDWIESWTGWASTRYEAKALREGRRPSYLTFRRR